MTPSKEEQVNKGNPPKSDNLETESDQATGETVYVPKEMGNNLSRDQKDPEAEIRDPDQDQTEMKDQDDHKLTESDPENDNDNETCEIKETPEVSEMAESHQSDQSNEYTEASQPEMQESEKCILNCKYRTISEPTGKSINCCLCQTSFHKECVNVDPNEKRYWILVLP